MKKLLFTLALYAVVVLITACGGNKTNEDNTETHTHEDGTVHEADHEEHVKTEQESFVVDADSTEAHDHDHEEGHDHQH